MTQEEVRAVVERVAEKYIDSAPDSDSTAVVYGPVSMIDAKIICRELEGSSVECSWAPAVGGAWVYVNVGETD